MAKKRKSIACRLDEVDRNMYSTFSSTASSLSQLYTQAMNQQKISFQEGQRHGLEKVHQWILHKYEEGLNLTPADIVAYLQNEIDSGGEDTATSPRMQPSLPNAPTGQVTNPGSQTATFLLGQATGGHGSRSGHFDQTKNSIFSNALSSPVRRSLQHCQLAHNGGYCPNNNLPGENGTRNLTGLISPNINRDTSSPCSNDTAMDMHSDSPARDFY